MKRWACLILAMTAGCGASGESRVQQSGGGTVSTDASSATVRVDQANLNLNLEKVLDRLLEKRLTPVEENTDLLKLKADKQKDRTEKAAVAAVAAAEKAEDATEKVVDAADKASNAADKAEEATSAAQTATTQAAEAVDKVTGIDAQVKKIDWLAEKIGAYVMIALAIWAGISKAWKIYRGVAGTLLLSAETTSSGKITGGQVETPR